MSSPLTNPNTTPEFKGYRIRQQTSTQQNQPNNQYLLKIFLKNQTNGIPKIRHDVICNGKLYPFIPLFTFTSQEDLGIVQQISTVVLRDENEILCQILSKKVTQIPASQFQDLKKRFQSIFALELKVDPEELFLLLVSDEIADQNQFNCILDSISQIEFVSLMKKVYQNCPTRLIPKILRRVTKYLNSTKGRTQKSVEKFKKLLKIIKSTDQSIDSQQKIQSFKKLQESPKKVQQKVQQKPIKLEKDQSSKQNVQPEQKKQVSKNKTESKKEQKPIEQKVPIQKPVLSLTKQEVEAAKKQSQAKRIEKAKEKKSKQLQQKLQLEKQDLTPQQQNSSDWHDVENSNDEDQEITNTIGKMAFHADDSDQDTKYQAPKKKNKKKHNPTVQLEPQFDSSAGRKNQKLKKQNKNQPDNSPVIANKITDKYRKISNESQQNIEDKIVQQPTEDRRNKNQKNNRRNQSRNDQSLERGNKQFTRDKKIDPRIIFGINGAPDAVWRERLRPHKYPRDQDRNQSKGKENYQTRTVKATPVQQKSTKQTIPKQVKESKNLTLQKVFSIPEDSKGGREFRFQKRHYNLFVNKLFWVNITDDQVTIQKEGKGYIRKCPVEIIDKGKGIMAEGVTLNIDGLSNLEDGGTSFGDPVFQEFTPQGQWFHISSLDVYAYV